MKKQSNKWREIAAISNRIDRKLRHKIALPATNPSPARNDYIAGAVVPEQVNAIIGEDDEDYPYSVFEALNLNEDAALDPELNSRRVERENLRLFQRYTVSRAQVSIVPEMPRYRNF